MRVSFKAKKKKEAVNPNYKPMPSIKENHARWEGFPNAGSGRTNAETSTVHDLSRSAVNRMS